MNDPADQSEDTAALDLNALYEASDIDGALATLDRELVGLAPVKDRVKEIAALLLVEKLRNQVGLKADPPSLHMSFTGNPGTGKTTVAMRMADILKKLGYVRQAEEIFVEDAPLWFFNYNKAVLAHQPWVHGLAPVAPEMMFQDMTSVWIDETSPRANMK